jgi:hypothetical protein
MIIRSTNGIRLVTHAIRAEFYFRLYFRLHTSFRVKISSDDVASLAQLRIPIEFHTLIRSGESRSQISARVCLFKEGGTFGRRPLMPSQTNGPWAVIVRRCDFFPTYNWLTYSWSYNAIRKLQCRLQTTEFSAQINIGRQWVTVSRQSI